MQRYYIIWRVHADWLGARRDLPRLPFAYVRRAKSKPPGIPDYPCHAVVYDEDAALGAIRATFRDGCHLMRVIKHCGVTMAEWARIQKEPGAVMVWPNQAQR